MKKIKVSNLKILVSSACGSIYTIVSIGNDNAISKLILSIIMIRIILPTNNFKKILETLAKYNVEGRPIWKPMHMQPIYRLNPFVVRDGNGRARSNAYIAGGVADVGMDIFTRGLCLPSDNKMTVEQQDRIIEVIRACFE